MGKFETETLQMLREYADITAKYEKLLRETRREMNEYFDRVVSLLASVPADIRRVHLQQMQDNIARRNSRWRI